MFDLRCFVRSQIVSQHPDRLPSRSPLVAVGSTFVPFGSWARFRFFSKPPYRFQPAAPRPRTTAVPCPRSSRRATRRAGKRSTPRQVARWATRVSCAGDFKRRRITEGFSSILIAREIAPAVAREIIRVLREDRRIDGYGRSATSPDGSQSLPAKRATCSMPPASPALVDCLPMVKGLDIPAGSRSKSSSGGQNIVATDSPNAPQLSRNGRQSLFSIPAGGTKSTSGEFPSRKQQGNAKLHDVRTCSLRSGGMWSRRHGDSATAFDCCLIPNGYLPVDAQKRGSQPVERRSTEPTTIQHA